MDGLTLTHNSLMEILLELFQLLALRLRKLFHRDARPLGDHSRDLRLCDMERMLLLLPSQALALLLELPPLLLLLFLYRGGSFQVFPADAVLLLELQLLDLFPEPLQLLGLPAEADAEPGGSLID